MLRLALTRSSALAAVAALFSPQRSCRRRLRRAARALRFLRARRTRSDQRSSPCAAQDPLSSGLVREERNPGSAESGGRTIRGLGGTTSRAFSAVVTLRLNNTVFFRLLSGPPSLLGRLLSGPASLPGRLPPGHGCRPPTRRVLAARQGSTPAPLRCAAANCTRSARRVACGRRPGRSPARGPRPFRRPGERSPARSEKLADALTPTP